MKQMSENKSKLNACAKGETASVEDKPTDEQALDSSLSALVSAAFGDVKTRGAIFGDFYLKGNEMERDQILAKAFECMFTKPVGTGSPGMELVRRVGYNNRTWANYCLKLLGLLSEEQKAFAQKNSVLFLKYGSFWPNCSDKITGNILSLDEVIITQNKIKSLLAGLVKKD